MYFSYISTIYNVVKDILCDVYITKRSGLSPLVLYITIINLFAYLSNPLSTTKRQSKIIRCISLVSITVSPHYASHQKTEKDKYNHTKKYKWSNYHTSVSITLVNRGTLFPPSSGSTKAQYLQNGGM